MGAPKLRSSQHWGLLRPGAGWECTQRDPYTSPESRVLDRAPKSASSVCSPVATLTPCLLSSFLGAVTSPDFPADPGREL